MKIKSSFSPYLGTGFKYLFVLLLSCNLALASEEKKVVPKIEYVDIKPSFVVNFGGGGEKLKFAKVDVSIQVADITDAGTLGNNFPLIRNTIVLLLSRQSAKDMSTSTGQEKIRKEALKEVQQVLKDETGKKIAQDLFFTNFVIQQ